MTAALTTCFYRTQRSSSSFIVSTHCCLCQTWSSTAAVSGPTPTRLLFSNDRRRQCQQTSLALSPTHSAWRTVWRRWRTRGRIGRGWSTAAPCWSGRRWGACSTCTWRWRPWWRWCRRRRWRTSRPGTSACSRRLQSTCRGRHARVRSWILHWESPPRCSYSQASRIQRSCCCITCLLFG